MCHARHPLNLRPSRSRLYRASLEGTWRYEILCQVKQGLFGWDPGGDRPLCPSSWSAASALPASASAKCLPPVWINLRWSRMRLWGSWPAITKRPRCPTSELRLGFFPWGRTLNFARNSSNTCTLKQSHPSHLIITASPPSFILSSTQDNLPGSLPPNAKRPPTFLPDAFEPRWLRRLSWLLRRPTRCYGLLPTSGPSQTAVSSVLQGRPLSDSLWLLLTVTTTGEYVGTTAPGGPPAVRRPAPTPGLLWLLSFLTFTPAGVSPPYSGPGGPLHFISSSLISFHPLVIRHNINSLKKFKFWLVTKSWNHSSRSQHAPTWRQRGSIVVPSRVDT